MFYRLASTTKRRRPIFIFHFNHYQNVICVSFYCSLKMVPEEGRNVCNKLITITLAEIFVMKILASSQPVYIPFHAKLLIERELSGLVIN